MRRFLAAMIFTLFSLAGASSEAADRIVPLETALITTNKNGFVTCFDGTFELNPSTEIVDILRRGISLTFILEVSVTQSRWYWTDKKIAFKQERMRLSYNPLTRQYRVSLGSLNQNFENLDQALQMVSTVRDWVIKDGVDITSGEFEAKARFFLDTSRLPKPLQVSLDKGSDWTMDSGWFDVKITSEPGE